MSRQLRSVIPKTSQQHDPKVIDQSVVTVTQTKTSTEEETV